MATQSEPEIRAYGPEDHDALRVLARELHDLTRPATTRSEAADPAFDQYFGHLLEIESELRGAVLVACLERQLVGFVCVLGVPGQGDGEPTGEPYAFLSDLYVRPAYRRQGIGARLTADAEFCSRELGASRVALRVAADNKSALGFYRAQSYGEQFLVMSKKL